MVSISKSKRYGAIKSLKISCFTEKIQCFTERKSTLKVKNGQKQPSWRGLMAYNQCFVQLEQVLYNLKVP